MHDTTRNNYSSNYVDSNYVDYTLGSRKLFEGCKGSDVKELQHLLVVLGLLTAGDGYFGKTTKLAVIKFQQSNSLTAEKKRTNSSSHLSGAEFK